MPSRRQSEGLMDEAEAHLREPCLSPAAQTSQVTQGGRAQSPLVPELL